MAFSHRVLSCGAVLACSLILASVGCGGAGESAENTAAVDEALNETGCGTVTADVSGVTAGTLETSPSASYDHGTSCPLQYVVEYNVTPNRSYAANAGWTNNGGPGSWDGGHGGVFDFGNGINQATCANALMSIGLYAHTQGGSWTTLNTTKSGYYVKGSWILDDPTGGWGGGDLPAHCDWVLYSTNYSNLVTINGNYDKVRVVARGMSVVGGVVTKRIIKVILDDITI